jgi:hypothetical protein
MEKRNEKVKKNLPNQRKTKGNSCIIRSTEGSIPSRTHQNENKEKELGHMLNKKWFTGALLGAFLGLGVITGSPQAEASALSAAVQPTSSGIVIVVDPFHDHYRHPAPPPRHFKHHGPPPHRKHHPRPHHPRPHHR